MITGEASRWVGYDEAAGLLGLSPEATKRLALRRGWPRRADPTGETEVALPSSPPYDEEEPGDAFDMGQGGTRTLVGYLELRVDQLTEELAEARMEMRGVRFESETLRVDAARTQVFAALVEAERARSAEFRAERDRLADELAKCRRPWLVRLFEAVAATARGKAVS
jgi:hypothetical protein